MTLLNLRDNTAAPAPEGKGNQEESSDLKPDTGDTELQEDDLAFADYPMPQVAQWQPDDDEEDFARLTTNEDWCIAFYKSGIYKRTHLLHKTSMPVIADAFFIEKVETPEGMVWGLFCQKAAQTHEMQAIQSPPYLLDCFPTVHIALDRIKWLTEAIIREIDARLRSLWGAPTKPGAPDDKEKRVQIKAQIEEAEEQLKQQGRSASWLQIFAPEEITKAKNAWQNDDSKKKGLAMVSAMSQYGGMRMVPSFPSEYAAILEKFPHFDKVIEHIDSELFLSTRVDPDKFYIQPILVNGDPGLGKTYFFECLAEMLGVPFFKISCGSVHGGFEITGTSQHWRNSTPGKIFTALSSTPFATPLIFLDEVDKLRDSSEHPVAPAFLDLLEPRTAAKFKDEAAVATFDASRCIFVASSNDVDSILPALISRFKVFDVPLPSVEQNRAIFTREFLDMTTTFKCAGQVKMPEHVLQTIAASGMPPRAIAHQMRRRIGDALKSGASEITFEPDETKGAIGFIR